MARLAAPMFIVSEEAQLMMGHMRLENLRASCGAERVDRFVLRRGRDYLVSRLGGKRLLRLMREAEGQHRRGYAEWMRNR